MSKKFVFLRKEKTIAIIEIFNEKKKNALCYNLLLELKNSFLKIEGDKDIRAIILTGRGDTFCSGMDIEWLLKEGPISMRKVNIWIQEVFSYIEQYKKPVIAALNGNTLGAGLILALICDLRLAWIPMKDGKPNGFSIQQG
jgi:enoyl-CoA hydratase/carnithine racemase